MTSLYRELEQKTIFPISSRPIHRAEYVVGKYAGTLLTLGVFIALDGAAVLLILARHGGRSWGALGAAVALLVAVPALVAWRVPRSRTFCPSHGPRSRWRSPSLSLPGPPTIGGSSSGRALSLSWKS